MNKKITGMKSLENITKSIEQIIRICRCNKDLKESLNEESIGLNILIEE